jgi:hypothetical protein
MREWKVEMRVWSPAKGNRKMENGNGKWKYENNKNE